MQALPEAMQFIQQRQTALRHKPFAAFLGGIPLAIANGIYRAQVTELASFGLIIGLIESGVT